MVLYRPVGEAELKLIADSGYKEFPPRLPDQPIFYPVLNEKYASEIAEKWNAVGGNKGFVTRFVADDSFCRKYQVRTVGRSYPQELWIPAEELEEFNRHIIGDIEVIRTFGGE